VQQGRYWIPESEGQGFPDASGGVISAGFCDKFLPGMTASGDICISFPGFYPIMSSLQEFEDIQTLLRLFGN
jgi:hypothetical protein